MRLPIYQIPCSQGGLWDGRVLPAASSCISSSICAVSAVGTKAPLCLCSALPCCTASAARHHPPLMGHIGDISFGFSSKSSVAFTGPEYMWIPEAVSSTPPKKSVAEKKMLLPWAAPTVADTETVIIFKFKFLIIKFQMHMPWYPLYF